MLKLLAALLFAVILRAQPPASEAKDPLGRSTPQESVFHFLEACHSREYSKAIYYLDLRQMPAAARSARAGRDPRWCARSFLRWRIAIGPGRTACYPGTSMWYLGSVPHQPDVG